MGTTHDRGSGQLPVRGLASWVASSCERHRVPVKVTDPDALARVAVLLGAADQRPVAAVLTVVRGGPVIGSEPPDRIDTVGVEPAGAGRTWADHNMIQDGGDDRGLSGEVEVGPLAV